MCDRPYPPDESACGNVLCNRDDRWFSWNIAISMRTGQLKRAIDRYKYQGRWGWALIFGRVVAGFLEEHAVLFRQFDVITASPTYVGPDGRSFDHTNRVLTQAAVEVSPGTMWPFDITGEPVIVKTGPTPPMVGNGYQDRRRYRRRPAARRPESNPPGGPPREARARLRRRVHRRPDAERGRPGTPARWRC